MSSASSAPASPRASKRTGTTKSAEDDDMLPEYDFSNAIRGRLSERFAVDPEDRALARTRADAELQRLAGVGPAYAALLRRSGIGSLRQLSNFGSGALLARLVRTNSVDPVVKRLPNQCVIDAWVNEATSIVASA